MKDNFKIIGFDADDTLWVNEPYFRETELRFCELLTTYGHQNDISNELLKIEMQNIELYGFGVKSFILSMIETALKISNNQIEQTAVSKIINLGKEILIKPVVLLNGVKDVLDDLYRKGAKLIVATKGDLLDQERKLEKSEIKQYFHHIEIMSDKKEDDYKKLLSHLEILPNEFLMIGNSLKSDIIPVLNIGGYGVHIPYHTTWQYENKDDFNGHKNHKEIDHISEVLDFCKNENNKS